MRTIDADKACKAIENYRIKKDTYGSLMNEWDRGYNYGLDRAEAEIQDFIVEAIPIEWIKERMNNIEDTLLEMAWSMLISEWAEEKEE